MKGHIKRKDFMKVAIQIIYFSYLLFLALKLV